MRLLQDGVELRAQTRMAIASRKACVSVPSDANCARPSVRYPIQTEGVREHVERACMNCGVAHGLKHSASHGASMARAARTGETSAITVLRSDRALHMPSRLAVSTASTPLTTAYSRYHRHRCMASGESAYRDHRQTRQNGRSRVRLLNARHCMMALAPRRAR